MRPLATVLRNADPGCGLDDRGIVVRIPAKARYIYLHSVHIGSGTHAPTDSFLVGNAVGGVKLSTLHLVGILRMRGAKPPLPQTSIWHSA
jgi:hypothetical protein